MAPLRIWIDLPEDRDDDAAAVAGLVLEVKSRISLGRSFEGLPLSKKKVLEKEFEFTLYAPKRGMDAAFCGSTAKTPGGKSGIGTRNAGGVFVLPAAATLAKALQDRDYPPYKLLLANTRRALEALLTGEEPAGTSTRTNVVGTLEELDRLVEQARASGYVVFDFETKPEEPGLSRSGIKEAALDHTRSLPTVLGLCFKPGEGWAVPLYHFDSPFDTGAGRQDVLTDYDGNPVESAYAGERDANRNWCEGNNVEDMVREVVMPKLLELMRDPEVVKCGHNVKFDLRVFSRFGYRTNAGEPVGRIDDTLIMHQILDETTEHGLKELTAPLWPEYGGYGDNVDYANEPMETLAPYCVADCDLTYRLRLLLEKRMLRDPKLYRAYRNMETTKIKLLSSMEVRGMGIDPDGLDEAAAEAEMLSRELTKVLKADPDVQRFCLAKQGQIQAALLEELTAKLDKFQADARAQLEERIETAKGKPRVKLLEALVALYDPLGEAYPYKRGRDLALKIEKARNEPQPYELSPASPAQLGEFIYSKEGLGYEMPFVVRQAVNPATGLKETIRGKHPSTDKDELAKLDPPHPVLSTIIELRLVEQLNGTFITGVRNRMDKLNRVHSSFSTVKSWRLGSANPNLQNIPSRTQLKRVKPLVAMVKRMFTPPEGMVFFQADLSQAELRWAAYLWDVRSMQQAYLEGKDLHVLASAKANNMTEEDYWKLKQEEPDKAAMLRYQGKALNFGFLYGMSAETYREYARVTYGLRLTDKQAEKQRDAYFALHPGILKGHAKYVARARKFGYVRTAFGNRRILPYIGSNNPSRRSGDERIALNSPIQGSSAQALIFALGVFRQRARIAGLEGFVANTVHDSAIGWVKPEHRDEFLKLLHDTLACPPTLKWFGLDFAELGMKVDVETGKNWKDLEPFKV